MQPMLSIPVFDGWMDGWMLIKSRGKFKSIKRPMFSSKNATFPDGESELQNFPGRPSLQRALHHLNRLKLLVEEPTKKHREEEKDEDEGRYSSSSADRLMTSQKEPS